MVEAWLQLYTLGPFAIQMAGAAPEAAAQGGPSPLRRKTRALLAYLAAAPAPVRRETLAAQLFGASDDPLGALRWQLSLIRRQLGPVLRTVDRGSLQLNREACWIDTAAFERDLAEGSTERLAAALRLYRGEYLAGLSLPDAPEFELWLLGRRAHYRKRYEQVLAELATALIAQGRLTDALSWAQLLVQSDALLEEGNLLLIRLYALTGQRDAALAHFEHYRRLLRAELGAEPDPTIAALHAAIAAGRPLPGLQPRAAPEGPQALRPTLPAPTTPLLGRETELAQLEAMLSDPTYRLVTIVGPGGIGKTRLALHVAAELAFRQPALFSDGVHVAELAAVPSGEALVPAIADTLGYTFSGAGDPKRQLLAQLQGQKLLLVLDNFEHLAAEAGLLTELLRAAPGMTLLVTSRGRLSLYEEWCFELRGLATPDQAAPEEAIEASSTVQLFVTRAPPPAPVRSRAGVGDHRPHLPAARGQPPGDRAGHAGQPAPRYPQPDEL